MGNDKIYKSELTIAYQNAEKFAGSHYENFPVVSLFLPKDLRKHIAVVYMFARQADDIADEGKENAERRMHDLEYYEKQLSDCLNGVFANDFWMALYSTIKEYQLTHSYFFDLLSAFKQDVRKNSYNTFDELKDYCKRSANPVGRIILEFFGIRDTDSIKYSDAVCTALQLTNFYQDISIDIENKRIYIPKEELTKFSVDENSLVMKKFDSNVMNLLRYQVDRTEHLFEMGQKLIPRLPKKLRFQIRLTILGGSEILKKIKKLDYNTLNYRPVLSKIDFVKLFTRAVLN